VHWWSKEEIDYLKEQYKFHAISELLPMFNEHFNVDISYDQLKGTIARHKILSGRDGRFEKGKKAWNKGIKGLNLAGENGRKTQFKKGQAPVNYRPVGSERVNVDGYVEIKVMDPNKWKPKHRVVWEEFNGPIPKGHVVIFGDSNRLNFDIDNLILVTRKQLVRLNQNKLIKDNADLTRTGIIIADLYGKISEISK
jgi:hypothetical protein